MTETYRGHVRSPADAIKLFEACRLGLLPRVQRRLSEKERQSITSGSVFVWDEREAGMRRWTDGKSWSASRVSGSFLTYREMEGKRGGGSFVPAPRRLGGKSENGRGSDEDAEIDGDGPDGYKYKADGLMKQSFSITTSSGQHLHLISYYARSHSGMPDLPQPTTDPALRHIVPVKGMYPESTVHDQAPPSRASMQSPYMSSPQQMISGPSPQGLSRGPYPYPQGYGQWPPSPVPTPPYNYPPGMYASQLPPPPPNGHPSPHQYSPHQHLPPHLQQHPLQQHPSQQHPSQQHPSQQHPSQQHPQQHPSQQNGYDRPPQLSHDPRDTMQPRHLSASGPPPQMSTDPRDTMQPRHLSASGPPPPMSALAYATNAARDAQQVLAQQQAQQAQRLGQLQQLHQTHQGPALIDPRLATGIPPLHHQQHPQHQQHQQQQQQQQSNGGHPLQQLSAGLSAREPTTAAQQSAQPQQRSPRLNGVSNPQQPRDQQPQSIPSISNLVHGPPSSGPPPPLPQPQTTAPPSNGAPSPVGRSPTQRPSSQQDPSPTQPLRQPLRQQSLEASKANGNGSANGNGHVRRSASPPVPKEEGQRQEGQRREDQRTGDEATEGGRPQEIPHAKLAGPSFGDEDMRALRVLDRKFCI